MKLIVMFVCLLAMQQAVAQTINVNVVKPTHNQVVEDQLQIQVSVSSTYEIDTVFAKVEGRETGLVHSGATGYTGQLSLTGLAFDTLDLVVTARDVFNNERIFTRKFIHDRRPQLIVETEPWHASVARPTLRIKARTVDNADSVRLRVHVYGSGYHFDYPVYYDSIDMELDLSYHEGRLIYVDLFATDRVGLGRAESGEVVVESSPYLEEIYSTQYDILDFKNNRLFTSSIYRPGTARIVNMQTHAVDSLPHQYVDYNHPERKIFLTEYGAIYNVVNLGYYEWHNGTLKNLIANHAEVAGNYAALMRGDSLFLRNISTQTNTFIAKPHGSGYRINGTVAANGLMPYQVSRNIINNFEIYHNGVVKVVKGYGLDTIFDGFKTDGHYIVYNRLVPAMGNFNARTYMYDGTTETELGNLGSQSSGVNPYEVNNRYIAYTKPGTSGQFQIWLRNPAGEHRQITFYGTGSDLESLAPNGDMTFRRYQPGWERRFFSTKTGSIQEISGWYGTPYFIDSSLYIAIGRKLFRVNLNIAPNTVRSFEKSGPKDSLIRFSTTDFTSNFTGSGNLVYVKITRVPTNGELRKSTLQLSVGSTLLRSELHLVNFKPNPGFVGVDSAAWDGSNSIQYTGNPATIKLTVVARPQPPIVTGLQNSYCSNQGMEQGKIANLPAAGSGTTAVVKLDGNALAIAADSTFSFNVSTLSEGMHTVLTIFSNAAGADTLLRTFAVTAAVTPDVNVSANLTTVVNLVDPVVVTASNAAGGGTSPLYTFARDRNFSNILQAEGTNNAVTISPASLALGESKVYVRMKTSLTCFTQQTAIDSIVITKFSATGLIDPDFPNNRISSNPNPFRSRLTIHGLSATKTYTVMLYSPQGRLMQQVRITGRTTAVLPVPGQSSGVYQLSIYDETKKRLIGTMQVVKQ